jgi:HEPN domain-containing protein
MKRPSEEPPAWFDKADKDLKVAELALSSDPNLADEACYHAQQCAEKYLKGFSVARNTEFPFTHDLARLVELCSGLDAAFAALEGSADALYDFATEARYPSDELPELTAEVANLALRHARQVRDFVRAKLAP